MKREDISIILRRWEDEQREERADLLKESNEKWDNRRKILREICRDVFGHDWKRLPANGLNVHDIKTGKWPHICKICDVHGYPED